MALPVALYLFLQQFGENEYNIPIFYESGIKTPLPNCPETENSPHTIGNFSLLEVGGTSWSTRDLQGVISVISFAKKNCDFHALMETARISNKYRSQPAVKAVTLSLYTGTSDSLWTNLRQSYQLSSENWSWLSYHGSTDSLLRCGLNLPDTGCEVVDQLVLLDNKLRIRGYYSASDPKEVDRLVTEIEILLINREDD